MDRDEERVRERALEIWKEEGKPIGREMEHWLRAERDVGHPTRDVGSLSNLDERPTASVGSASGLQPSGTKPGGSPGAGMGSIGTGGGSTAGAATGSAKTGKDRHRV
jgi:hypothetical protein